MSAALVSYDGELDSFQADDEHAAEARRTTYFRAPNEHHAHGDDLTAVTIVVAEPHLPA